MAFFKFRKAVDEPASAPVVAHGIEALRQRAKYRLVGASVLVLLGVIGFPLLFDKQPRPISVDTPIAIPDRNKVPPLTLPVTQVSGPEVPASTGTEPAIAVAPLPSPLPPVTGSTDTLKVPKPSVIATEPGVITEMTQPVKSDKELVLKLPLAPVFKASSAIKGGSIDETKTIKPAGNAATAQALDAAKALAALEGKTADTPAPAQGRFVVQVGAFADSARAHEVRLKLERAGLKTYTHVAETKDGRRIRVRVGPFSVKPEAEKAAVKIRKLDLPAALLTL
jgi:DedD protein